MMIQEVLFQKQVVTFTAQSCSTAASPARPCADSVSLSPEAKAGRKAETLVTALDADKDGGVSEEEFVDGAKALLRRASHRRRPHDDESEGGVDRKVRHGSHRLEHRLERIFDKVDANGDGALDAGELTAALSGAVAPPRPEHTMTAPAAGPSAEAPIPASTSSAGAPLASSSFTSVTFQFTFVSIAVRQYQVSGQEQALSPPPQLQASA